MECIDAAMAALASNQHGLVTVDQLAELGASRQQVRTRLDRGRWTKVRPSVIRINGAEVSWESEVMAAVLGAGPGALASHKTAAALWELEGFGGRSRPEPPELTVPRGRRVRCEGVVVHQSTDLDRTTPAVIQGIPTTLVTRTLLDLGAVLPPSKVLAALDSARRRKLTTWDGLLDTLVVHARRGRDGVGTLRILLDDHFGEVAATKSGLERLVAVVLSEAGLPAAALRHEVRVGRHAYQLDLAYPDLMVAIELEGSERLDRLSWERGHARQNALINAGWTVLRFSWRDYKERRAHLVADVRTAIERTERAGRRSRAATGRRPR